MNIGLIVALSVIAYLIKNPVIIIVFIIILFIVFIYDLKRAPIRKKMQEYYELNNRLFYKGIDSYSESTVKSCLFELETGFNEIEEYLPSISKKCYLDDIQDLREQLTDIQTEKWEKTADQILKKFIESFELITKPTEFANIDQVYKAREKCLDSWYEYWQSIHDCEAVVYPKKYMKENLDDRFEPCMWDSASLKKRLDDCITQKRPEYLRKMKIIDAMISSVESSVNMLRSELLKTSFADSTPEEVRSCYNALLKSHKMFEWKLGNRWFVSLSDKYRKSRQTRGKKLTSSKSEKQVNPGIEQAAPLVRKSENTNGVILQNAGDKGVSTAHRLTNNAKEKEGNRMIAPRMKLLYRELVRHFDEEGIEYVDKTVSGGSLYFFSETEAENLKKKDYPVLYAASGSKATNHRPAWYIKL